MKKLYQYTMILLAGVVGACSSLDVSDPYSENLPSDFSAQTYMEMYPYLRKFQYKDFAEARNLYVQDSLKALDSKNYRTTYKALKEADEANFKAMDPAILAEICKDPFMGGYPAESCVNVAANAEIMKDLIEFNMIGIDDYSALRNFPVDEVAISQQYVIFGRSHGWAYRWCTEAETQDPDHHPARELLPIAAQQSTRAESPEEFVADTGLYCRDAAGVVRLIQ